MNKFKALVFLVFGAALAIFVAQNWQYPNPPVHFLGFQFLPLPMSLIILGALSLGFLAGWLTCVLKAKGSHPEKPPETPPEG